MTGFDSTSGPTGRAARLGQRPVLRVALFGIAVALIGFTVIASYSIWRMPRHHAGERFTGVHDPAAPSPRGFPAGPGADDDDDNDALFIFLGYACAVAVIVPLWWGMRGLRFRHAAGQPGRAMVADPRIGRHTGGTGIAHPSTWLILNDIGNPVPYGWQRVMWHPAVEKLPDETEVIVRGRLSASGPVGTLVVELPGGVRLVPVGAVQREAPKRFRLTSRPGVNVVPGPDGRVVVSRDDPPLRPRRWWRRAPRLALVGVLLGGGLGCGVDGAVMVLPGCVLMSTVLLTGWTLSGGEP